MRNTFFVETLYTEKSLINPVKYLVLSQILNQVIWYVPKNKVKVSMDSDTYQMN